MHNVICEVDRKFMIFINVSAANFATENFLLLAKPFMGNILEKCEMFGTQKRKWLPHILRKISKSQLPPWYGGEQNWKCALEGGARLEHNSTIGRS